MKRGLSNTNILLALDHNKNNIYLVIFYSLIWSQVDSTLYCIPSSQQTQEVNPIIISLLGMKKLFLGQKHTAPKQQHRNWNPKSPSHPRKPDTYVRDQGCSSISSQNLTWYFGSKQNFQNPMLAPSECVTQNHPSLEALGQQMRESASLWSPTHQTPAGFALASSSDARQRTVFLLVWGVGVEEGAGQWGVGRGQIEPTPELRSLKLLISQLLLPPINDVQPSHRSYTHHTRIYSPEGRQNYAHFAAGKKLRFIKVKLLFKASLTSEQLSKCFFFPFQGHTHNTWKFPGQGLNQGCSCWPTPQPQQCSI